MARNAETIDYRDDYYHGLAGLYFTRILKTLIRFGNLDREHGIILDFGCGVGHLRKLLKNDNVVGYDIIPELSSIEDYRNLIPQKIVLSGVLEHLYGPEISKLLDEFRVMNPRAELLVFLPTENRVSKIAMRLTGQTNAHDDHVSKYRDINEIIERHYRVARRKYLFLRMAQVTHYVSRH